MEPSTEGNLLEIMDLARTLRQEQLFIQQEQAAFAQLTDTLTEGSTSITKLAYICAQQRQNLNDLIISRPEIGPLICCRRANNYENSKFIDAKKVLDYEHVIAYEQLFNYLYRSPYLLAMSLATADRLPSITQHHVCSVIHTITTGLFGNAINTKDVEMILKLLRELIELQIVVSNNPRRMLRANSSAFARLYQRLNESMFSAKIFLTAALFEPIMNVLSDSDTILDIDPKRIVQNFSSKERLRRFGAEDLLEYQQNVDKFHYETIKRLHALALTFIDSIHLNWSLFPSTLLWLVQTMYHLLKQTTFSDELINELITDMVFTHYICPAIVSPDIIGIIDAPISEQVRFNLMQIGQIIQMLALAKHGEVETKFAEIYAKFEANTVSKLIDMLLVTQSGEDVVAILSQQSSFERIHLLSTQTELNYFVEFFRILLNNDEFDISNEEKEKLKKNLSHLPETQDTTRTQNNGEIVTNGNGEMLIKERSKQSLMSLKKATKNKIVKTMSFSTNGGHNSTEVSSNAVHMLNGFIPNMAQASLGLTDNQNTNGVNSLNGSGSSTNSSPTRAPPIDGTENESVLVFSIYNNDENKLQPLTEEEVLKMNSIGQEISGDGALLVDAENCNMNAIDKSSVVNGYDGIDGMSDVLRPLHGKTTRFSLSHDDASIGNSDNLEAVSEAPSNHSVTSSLELEENDQNDNLSDMVSANVSGRGTPNISGRDTPSSQVTDGGSINNAIPTPQMQKLISKVRSDIEDKFCKFEIKKFEGDETVSIISDTWSTDVLASDSETLDTSDRDRDRNFSTPLIPSAVVLPGDNNFDALSNAGSVRPGYLDISDQRSESNWSTDVLASDSEKLAEVDTDDNLSITAKSDITDAGGRLEAERDQLAAAISAPASNQTQRTPDLPYYVSAIDRNVRRSLNYNREGARAIDMGHGSGSSGGNASDRSQEDSAFFDAVTLYDDNGAAIAGSLMVNGAASASSLHHYQGLSSLARSSVHTAENSFQHNYKNSNSEGKEPFLSTPRMRRQTSAESSISNQSINSEEVTAAGKPPKSHHKPALKKKKQINNYNKATTNANETRDLIDFSDFGEEKEKKNSNKENELRNSDNLIDIFGDDAVEHRRFSSAQRSTAFDGRRNGILAMKSDANSNDKNSTPSLRRHQSLSYENHEIMINAIIPKRVSAMPNLKGSSQTDDDKTLQQEQNMQQLCAKTKQLVLNDTETNDVFNGIVEPAEAPTTSNGNAANSNTAAAATGTQKPSKSTGAIPKSISFDASADKSNEITVGRAASHRNTRVNEAVRFSTHHSSSGNSGLFNKLKQGIFKHRRSNKSHRHSALHSDEFSQSSRSVSFSTNASEVSLDLINGVSNVRNGSVGYSDITEDILAKYRRKVSTSSDATNSDSTGNSGQINRKNAILEANRLSNSMLHDKTIAFNIIKKKIRTVLSKTDLHTADFRHTTYSNSSPLLTYLQIQLAQAINLQNFQQISYVSEAIRCISSLEKNQHVQLLEELQEDIQKRQNYLQYLMRFRQNLLLIMENIEQFESRLRGESVGCNRYLMSVCIRLFIEKRQDRIESFQEEFTRLTVSDDKIDLIEEFIDELMKELLANGGLLCGMSDWQMQEARISIERILLQRMYQQVMFPNEDADLSRDTVLSEHIRKLQNVIRPSHHALCIPQEFLSEAPWTFAQQQLSYISAYKTPREKLQCVIRCISSIMSLLHMSSGRVPAADDLLPVLIYVVIMANPPYLLSTVEYISCFIGDKMDGEEQFHWTLFGSVVKFIKTMDYLD
ncbi:receptor-mediated endocytosis protein 6 homolog [Teleopsis dalmanni]|uniref:receptor-mediated endocytosis protein 6 homolog n=1 Tax=Teleopsis dalmanni TaxID=139649 RepID=UPI0018CF2DB0|nr:receptor-mediated endocytosis protein 6 homolog [Teleopsis dalmanni]